MCCLLCPIRLASPTHSFPLQPARSRGVNVNTNSISAFDQLALSAPVLKALESVGYEKPSPIQASTIPLLLAGRDVLGQAQTGTGKTAAFALPALSSLDIEQKNPQVLVLAPTRELAIQVAEAFRKYASHIQGFHVLPVYGGQDYRVQTRALERGVHVVVGTPGRIMDHMRRGNLKLGELKLLTLDEADEMLRMGFIDDVEWILEQIPGSRQIALFSATMPTRIKRIATRYLTDPAQVTIEVKTTTADTIRQRFWPVSGRNKLDALTRILEAETFNAMLIFVRTKTATVELSEKLEARGYASAPLNGDIQQKQRERTVDQLKRGKLDIIVATDVAARGLDVERISHVLNYDIPYDTEAYVHRIGRTGRAGRTGDAILFVAPREKRMMQTIERATGQRIEQMNIPSSDDINSRRIERFRQRITDTIENEDLSFFSNLIEEYQGENQHEALQIAAALAHLLQGDTPFLYATRPTHKGATSESDELRSGRRDSRSRDFGNRDFGNRDFGNREHGNRDAGQGRDNRKHKASDDKRQDRFNDRDHSHKDARRSERPHEKSRPDQRDQREHRTNKDNAGDRVPAGSERFRLEVGSDHGVQPGNIVGAIANEAGIDSQYIGSISINSDHSFVTLPEGMPKPIFKDLKKVWVCGQKLQISRVKDKGSSKSDSGNRHEDRFSADAPHHKERSASRGKSESRRADGRPSSHKKGHDRDRKNDRAPGRHSADRKSSGKDHSAGHGKKADRDSSRDSASEGGEFKPAKDRKVRKDRLPSDKKKNRKKGRLALGDEGGKKSLKAKRKRDDSVAINKKRIRSIKAKREEGSVSEYVPAPKDGKDKNKNASSDSAEVKS